MPDLDPSSLEGTKHFGDTILKVEKVFEETKPNLSSIEGNNEETTINLDNISLQLDSGRALSLSPTRTVKSDTDSLSPLVALAKGQAALSNRRKKPESKMFSTLK